MSQLEPCQSPIRCPLTGLLGTTLNKELVCGIGHLFQHPSVWRNPTATFRNAQPCITHGTGWLHGFLPLPGLQSHKLEHSCSSTEGDRVTLRPLKTWNLNFCISTAAKHKFFLQLQVSPVCPTSAGFSIPTLRLQQQKVRSSRTIDSLRQVCSFPSLSRHRLHSLHLVGPMTSLSHLSAHDCSHAVPTKLLELLGS